MAALQGGSEGEDDYIVKHSGAGVDLVESEEWVLPRRRPQGAGNKGSRLAQTCCPLGAASGGWGQRPVLAAKHRIKEEKAYLC